VRREQRYRFAYRLGDALVIRERTSDANFVTMRKVVYVLAGLLIALGLLAIGTVVEVHLKHPRDQAAYLAYLRKYSVGQGPVTLPPAALLVAEGDKACHWLGSQPMAYWRNGTSYRFPAVMMRYRLDVRGHAVPWGKALPSHHSVATAAWAYLCPATWQLHKPHYVFSDPNPGDPPGTVREIGLPVWSESSW